jgi:hypothetical protein
MFRSLPVRVSTSSTTLFDGQDISDRKKWRRSKSGRGRSKNRVSPISNSNSLPHSGTGQLARNFSLTNPSVVCGLTTTQVPHLGHVTHEHAMRSAIPRLYCAWNRAPWMAPGSGKIPTFLGLGNFVAVRTLGGGPCDVLGSS